jgi:pimeloyl-ACP methyl ester carboxylesterase
MVAYAYAAMYSDKVERLVVLDSSIPGIEPGTKSSLTLGSGTSIFAGLMQNDSRKDVNALISIGLATSSREIPASRKKIQETSSRRHTPYPEEGGPVCPVRGILARRKGQQDAS